MNNMSDALDSKKNQRIRRQYSTGRYRLFP
nr:MAG TPA: hypothetical protein [Caudoviricetes sp.]